MSDDSSNSKRIAKNSIFLSLRMIVVMAISIFTTRYLLQNLGVEDYGVYSVTIGIVSMCTFLAPSLANAIQRYYNYELGISGILGAKRVLNTGLLIQFALSLIFIFVCETIGLWYVVNKLVVPSGREEAVLLVYQISIFATCITFLNVPFLASILAHERMNFYAFVNVLDAVLKLSIAICIKYSSYDRLVFYSFLLLLVNIINILLYYSYCKIKFEETKINLKFEKKLFKEMLSFTGWNLFESIARIFKDQGCNLMFNYFVGPILNAARGLANQVLYAYSSIVESTVMAARPQMVQQYAVGNVNQSINLFYTLSKATLILIFTFGLPIFLEVDYILKLWLVDQIPEYTAILVRLSLLLVLIDKLALPVTALIHASGVIKKYHLLSSVINILVLPVSWFLLKYGYGVVSVYTSMIFTAVVAQILFVFILKNQINISIQRYLYDVCSRFILLSLLSMLLPLIVFCTFEPSFLRLVVVTAVTIASIIVSTYLIGLNDSERKVLLSLISKKK